MRTRIHAPGHHCALGPTCSPRRLAGWLSALLVVALQALLPVAPALAQPAEAPPAATAGRERIRAMPLAHLLDSGVTDLALDAASAERSALEARARQLEHGAGWQAFGALRHGDVREIVTETRDSRYETQVLTAGLQHPLLGSLWSQQRQVEAARVEAWQQAQRVRIAELAGRRQLRIAYADWWRAQEEVRWCDALMGTRAREMQRVTQRRAAGELTHADATRQLEAWRALEQRCERAPATHAAQFRRLQALTPVTLGLEHQALPEALLADAGTLLDGVAALDGHPLLDIARLKLEESRAARHPPWHSGIESRLQLAAAFESRPGFGRPGKDLSVAVSVAFPLDLGDYQDALRAEAEARYTAALAAHQAQSMALRQGFEQLRAAHLEALARVQDRRRHWESAVLAGEEARVRSEAGLGADEHGETALADGGFGLIESWHAAWLQQIELEQFAEAAGATQSGGAVATAATDFASPREDWTPPVPGVQQRHWTPPHTSPPGPEATAPAGRLPADSPGWSQGTYIWDSRALLDPGTRAETLAALQRAGMRRLLVGLTAAQIAEPETVRALLRALVDAAAAQGMEVALLLGDPGWISPAQRGALLQLVRLFDDLPLAALHLDLEVEQLGWPVPEQRLIDWLDTLRNAAETSPWPLEISSHHRWFDAVVPGRVCVPCALPEIGVQRVSLMIYTRNTERSSALAEGIAQRWPRLRFRLAQSVEPILPQAESWWGLDQVALEALGRRFRALLEPLGLEGLDWQDWNHYPSERDER